MEPQLTVSRSIAASPAAVFALLSDITRIGELSPECYAAEWNDGATTAAVGASFTGHNRNGDNEWSIGCEIVELVENERFFFDCSARDMVFAKWGYAIEATETGCMVTEYFEDLRPDSWLEGSLKVSGVADRATHNAAGMEATLERLAAVVE